MRPRRDPEAEIKAAFMEGYRSAHLKPEKVSKEELVEAYETSMACEMWNGTTKMNYEPNDDLGADPQGRRESWALAWLIAVGIGALAAITGIAVGLALWGGVR